ncbi:hypothetical protein B0O80DRAFT_491980, partial [Mortierella sp. GBAus27b]
MTDCRDQAKNSKAANDTFVAIDTEIHPLAAVHAPSPTNEELATSSDPIQSFPTVDSVTSANSPLHVHRSWKDGEEKSPCYDCAHRDHWANALTGTPDLKKRGSWIDHREIETCLAGHPLVQMAAVVMDESPSKRTVAYVVAEPEDRLLHTLCTHLASCLPDYAAPVTFVRLDTMPFTATGEIDREALPEPEKGAFDRYTFEEPQGTLEFTLSQIWSELLLRDCVSRHDNFFELGGHSLLVLRMLDCLQDIGWKAPVHAVYESPVLKDLAQELERNQKESLPLSLITPLTSELTPEMSPLISLTRSDADHIVEQAPGGGSNIQDIYPLLPLQYDILFHRLPETKGDPYLLSSQIAFENRDLLDRYLQASQKVVDRHDILRTAFIWKDVSTPAQVVWRHTTIPIQELSLDPANGPVIKQLEERFHPKHYRINLTRAPLIQYVIAQETDGRWMLFQLMHQLIGDCVASKMMNLEIQWILHGQEHTLPIPGTLRSLVMQTSQVATYDDHGEFFKAMLSDVENPTFPFGVSNNHTNNEDIIESYQILPQDLNERLRFHAKQMGVTMASLYHVAWAQVLAFTSGKDDVLFGTVLSGSQGLDNAMGPLINTLPFRCNTAIRVRECIQRTHIQLGALLERGRAPLSLAQRCSAIPSGTPLFTALFKYLNTLPSIGSVDGRWMMSPDQEGQMLYPGIEILRRLDRTNYPLATTVEESGSATRMTVQAAKPIDPSQVCGYMRQVLESLVKALEEARDITISNLEVMPAQERQLLLQTWNETQQEYPEHLCIHHLFEHQVERTPDATAVVFMDQSLSYRELNERANGLAHHLIGLGVRPDTRVAICVDRSLAMIVGVLAILKSGGAYIPLDPAYASERIRDMVMDADPSVVIADKSGRTALGEELLLSATAVDPSATLSEGHHMGRQHDSHVNPKIDGLTSSHLAYVIYTSGSTGKPKGVMVEHQGVVNLVRSREDV